MHPAPYSAYAPIYDAAGLDRAGAEGARATLAWLRAAGHAPRDALDLACGTGAAALALAAAGLRTSGVDRAPAMLRIAAGRARDARLDVGWTEADIRELTARRSSYDLVTCFGALHELAGDGDLARVLGGAAGRLRPGGWLAFDLWAPGYFAAREESDEVLHDGPDLLVAARLLLDGQGQVWGRRVVWFVREIERWWRGEETHALRAWAEDEALAGLAGAGLALALRREQGERVLYVARREVEDYG